jgi:predicted permease
MLRDLAYGVRSLRKSPSFTIIALLTIALGIGATTAIFSAVNAVLLRPLPYADAERLTLVWSDMRARDVTDFPIAPADFHDMREQATSFEQLGAVTTGRATINGEEGEPEQVRVAGITPNLLGMLGARVIAGRDFTDADGTPIPQPPDGVDPATLPPPPPASVILSHAFWQRRFGGEDVIGRTIDIGGPAEIVGVLAPGVELLFPPGTNVERNPDIWNALRVDYANGSRINVFLRVIGKLKPGVTPETAETQLEGIIAQLREEFPIKKTADVHWRAEPMHDDLVADVRPTIVALMGAVMFVLLIACANVANLLLVRSAQRERELAVRAALGGSRARLLSQMLAESLVLAAAGAALGVFIAYAGIRLLLRLQPDGLPRLETITIDPVVLGFTALVTLLAAVTFGLIPAWRASRTDVNDVLRETGRTGALARGKLLRGGVVIAEFALAFVLLIGSGLMLRSFAALQRIDPGYDPAGILTFNVNARGNDGERIAFYEQMEQKLATLPGVSAVSVATPVPLDGGVANARWGTLEAAADPARFQQANVHFVRPGYFVAFGARLIEGRTTAAEDNNPTTLNVVIDDVLAKKAFGSESAVGKQLLIRVRSAEPETFQVIGVVAHQRHVALSGEQKEAIFIADGLMGHGVASRWIVRAGGDPLALADGVRNVVREIDPRAAIADVQPMQALVDRAMAPTRFALVLIAVFAAIAALLAAIGLYGVLATIVRQRTAEIGVRVAFGASSSNIVALILRQGLALSIAGVVLGVIAAFAMTGVLSSMLVGVQPNDPLTYATTALTFLVVAAFACWLPARRAAMLNPTVALREE